MYKCNYKEKNYRVRVSMKIDRTITRQIEEAKYLATENTWRYRTIIRTIYKKYEQMKYSIYKEDIFEALKSYEDFQNYTIEQLKSDLDQLVNWRNLNATADTTKVNTIEEFKNREFRYDLSPVTVEIERMIIALEHMSIENTSSLESSLVEKFRGLIEKLPIIIREEEKGVYEWFKELNLSFQQLNRNYQDYISKFYSSKNDELMKTTEFLVYKEGFIKYLREFIRTLQLNSTPIRDVFAEVDEILINNLINKLFTYEKKIQSVGLQLNEEEYKELNKGRITSMMEWFVTFKGREPLVDQLINNTNEIIRRITRYAAAIADKKANNANRKEEYKKIARFFKESNNIHEANEISSLVLGTFNVMKVIGNENRDTESINSSIYDEAPREFVIRPKIRTYREKIVKNPIKNKEEKTKEKLAKVLERRLGEQKVIYNYIKDKSIDFGTLPIIPSKDRALLLRLLTKGISKKRQWHRGDMGLDYRVELQGVDNVIVKCDDGEFSMPHYKIIFKEDK